MVALQVLGKHPIGMIIQYERQGFVNLWKRIFQNQLFIVTYFYFWNNSNAIWNTCLHENFWNTSFQWSKCMLVDFLRENIEIHSKRLSSFTQSMQFLITLILNFLTKIGFFHSNIILSTSTMKNFNFQMSGSSQSKNKSIFVYSMHQEMDQF